ncbi:class I SAM-dependent methyltransferase [Synechococcus sp. PCC 6717]|nr:class I SAM-dependent methyltransferase [Synechococcus sp. PCC 6717]
MADSDAEDLIAEANLKHYVQFINARSDEVTIEGLVDLIFIDGDHSYEGCKADVFNYVPWYLRPRGYFILHDYYIMAGTTTKVAIILL